MKTAVLFLSAVLAAVEATNPTLHCPRPNANFCMGGDIILRCDSNGVATPGRCSSNLAGYAPAGGPASCYESEPNAGDAACQKNCVVYANKPYTLSGCRPTFTAAVPTATAAPNTTLSTLITVPTTALCKHCNTTAPPPGTNPPSSNPPGSNPPAVLPPYPNGNGTNPIGTGTGVGFPSPTGSPGNGGNNGGNNSGNNGGDNGGNGGNNGGNGGNGGDNGGNGSDNGNNNGGSTRTNVPVSPTTAISEPPPPSSAGANKASLILAAAGVIVAYIL